MEGGTVGAGAGQPDERSLEARVPRASGGREVRVGVFVLLGLASFLAVLFLLTDPATMRGRYLVVTTVDDAGGVRRGDPVQMRGVIIGRVRGFEMMPAGRVAITLEVEGEWRIPEGSRTRFGAAGIFGGRTMEVVPAEATTYHEEWDTLPGGETSSDLLGSMEDLSGEALTVLRRIDELLDPGMVSSVQGSASEMEGLLRELSAIADEQRGQVRSLTASLNRVSSGLEEAAAAGPDAARAVANAESAMAGLASTSENLDGAARSLRSVIEGVAAGEGTLGRLATDAELYDNLNRALASVTALLEDFQENPRRYVNLSIF